MTARARRLASFRTADIVAVRWASALEPRHADPVGHQPGALAWAV